MKEKPGPKIGLESIGEESRPRGRKSPAVKNEIEAWESGHREEMAKLRRSAYRSIHLQRKIYANKLFKLVAWWLTGLFLLVIADGWTGGYFRVSDTVMLAILGGTTINVLGLFAFVAKYLFPDPATKRPR